jgi:hypothetical protein
LLSSHFSYPIPIIIFTFLDSKKQVPEAKFKEEGRMDRYSRVCERAVKLNPYRSYHAALKRAALLIDGDAKTKEESKTQDKLIAELGEGDEEEEGEEEKEEEEEEEEK